MRMAESAVIGVSRQWINSQLGSSFEGPEGDTD
jgi:hypothetical protein